MWTMTRRLQTLRGLIRASGQVGLEVDLHSPFSLAVSLAVQVEEREQRRVKI